MHDLTSRTDAEVAALVDQGACVRELRDRAGGAWTTRSPAIRALRWLAGGAGALERAAEIVVAVTPIGRRARCAAAIAEVRALVAAEP